MLGEELKNEASAKKSEISSDIKMRLVTAVVLSIILIGYSSISCALNLSRPTSNPNILNSISETMNSIASTDDLAGELPQLPSPQDHHYDNTDNNSEKGPTRTFALGEALKLDDLGPIIVNTDGTTRRITNWDTLTKAEQETSWRLISARNKIRIAKLKSQQEELRTVNSSETNDDLTIPQLVEENDIKTESEVQEEL